MHEEIARLQQGRHDKNGEKDTVIALLRRGRIDESDLDYQLDQVQQEEAGVRADLADLRERLSSVQGKEEGLRGAQGLLERLAWELEEPITGELPPPLVEGIRIDTVQYGAGKKEAHVTVTYCFGPSTALGTDMHRTRMPAQRALFLSRF